MAKKKKSVTLPTVIKIGVIAILALSVGIFMFTRISHYFTESKYFRINAVVLDSSLAFIDKRELSNFKGKNIFAVDISQIQRHLTFKYPQVTDLRVVRRFPNQIHIKAKQRTPTAQVQSKDKVLTLNEKGVVLSSSEKRDDDLPMIMVDGVSFPRYTLGLPLPGTDYQIGLEIISNFKINHALSSINIDRIHVESASKVNVHLKNKLYVIFDSLKVAQRVKILGIILAQGKVNLKEAKYIDLRFKEPIVGKK